MEHKHGSVEAKSSQLMLQMCDIAAFYMLCPCRLRIYLGKVQSRSGSDGDMVTRRMVCVILPGKAETASGTYICLSKFR